METPQEFLLHFQSQKSELLDMISALKSQENESAILQKLSVLDKNLNQATSFLTPYDIRSCTEQIKDIRNEFTKQKSTFTKKKKFGFSKPTTTTKFTETAPSTQRDQPQQTTTKRIIPPPNAIQISDLTSTFFNLADLHKITKDPEIPCEIYIQNIQNSVISLLNPSGSEISVSTIQIYDVNNSVLILPPVFSSVLNDRLNDSVIFTACRQFRMHNSKDSKIFLLVNSDPIIEGCDRLRIGDYTVSAKLFNRNLSDLIKAANLSTETNLFRNIQDFNWLRAEQSPHWSLINDSSMVTVDSILSEAKFAEDSDFKDWIRKCLE